MTPEDVRVFAQIADRLPPLRRVALISPSDDVAARFRRAKVLRRRHWDLATRYRDRFDLIALNNVLMYSAAPRVWIDNLLASCRYLLLTEPTRRPRSAAGELGQDEDRMRYTVGDRPAGISGAFDLAGYGARLLGWRFYPGGENEYGDTEHVVALLRGDVDLPVLRVDDYPTGVRPLPADLEPLHDVLRTIDDAGIEYHLGIVPALLDDAMARFLTGLRWLVPVAHGWDHGYPEHSRTLLAAADPDNRRGTVGTFNEFAGCTPDEVRSRLTKGRQRLEAVFGRPVTGYIPPCNRGDRRTARALAELGYTHYLSERRIPGSRLPWRQSDFYGRSDQFAPGTPGEVFSLHATWELDLVREGNVDALPRLLGELQTRRAARARDDRLLAEQLFTGLSGVVPPD